MNSPTFNTAAREECRQLIRLALAEDLGSADPARQRDITSEAIVPESARGSAMFVSRQAGVICGLEVCREVLDVAQVQLNPDWLANDREEVRPGQTVATLEGSARAILRVERTCLNFLGRLSGISTLTSRFVSRTLGTPVRVLDTRKTTPGWRNLEKYAVACGGGNNHRMGLHDAVLIKDNHLALMDLLTDTPLDEIRQAVSHSRQWIAANSDGLPDGKKTIVEIEVDRLDQFDAALEQQPDVILLDNMSLDQLTEAVDRRNARFPRVLLEASGGISLESIGGVARTGVDRISVGALTHSAVNFDIGLDWRTE